MEGSNPYALTGVEFRRGMRGAELGNHHYTSFRNLFAQQPGAVSQASDLLQAAIGTGVSAILKQAPMAARVLHDSPIAHHLPCLFYTTPSPPDRTNSS